MCLQCITKAEVVLEGIVPSYNLMISKEDDERWHAGWYGLVYANSPSFVFHVDRFVPDPTIDANGNDLEDEDIDSQEFECYLKQVEKMTFSTMHYHEVIRLEKACELAGYNFNTDGFLHCWLYDRITKLFQEKFVRDRAESRRRYDEFMVAYHKDHACCPKCGSDSCWSTCIGFALAMEHTEDFQDSNEAICDNCHDIHTVHDRVPKTEMVNEKE